MGSKLDAKHEKQLRALLKLPDNKRCANCETTGPQYVVTDFNIFVCTVCSGVHRQFSHRCKGITMAMFKPEEMVAIEQGGNGVALAKYLARWKPGDYPKPTTRDPSKIKGWIETVWVKKQFWSDVKVAPPAIMRVSSSRSTASEEDIPVRAAADLLGRDTVRLQVGVGLPPLGVQSSTGSTSSQGSAVGGAKPAVPSLLDLLEEPAATPAQPEATSWAAFGDAPAAASAGPAPPAPASGGWAAFDTLQPAAAPVPPAPLAATPAPGGWAAFDAPQPSAAPVPPPAFTPGHAAATPEPASGGWQAFGGPASVQATPVPAVEAKAAPPVPARQELPSDLFSEMAAPVYAPAVPGYGDQRYGTAPRPQYPAGFQQYAPTAYNPTGFVQPGAPTAYNPTGFVQPGALAHPTPAIPQFAAHPAAPQYPSGMGGFPPSNGALMGAPQNSASAIPAFLSKVVAADDAPDPFSTLVPGLKAALPVGTGGSGFGSAPGFASPAQTPTNGQIPALHANPKVGFGAAAGGGSGPPAAKTGNPFA